MRPLTLTGVVLIALGIVGLALGHITFTTEKKVLDLGPIHATQDEEHHIAIPDVAAIAALIAGLGLVFAGQNRT